MQEKSKDKEHEISWAYRLSKRLHLLKRDQIEVAALPEECLHHLEKKYARDICMRPFEVEIISNYKAYEVILRSIDKSPKGGEAFFILCRLEEKGDKTIISLEVSLGKMLLFNLIGGLFILPLFLLCFTFFTRLIFNVPGELGGKLLLLPLWLIILLVLMIAVWFYPHLFQERNKMLEYIVTYMFRVEENLATQHPIEATSASEASQLERS